MATRKTQPTTVDDLLASSDAKRRIPADNLSGAVEIPLEVVREAGTTAKGNPTKAFQRGSQDFGTGVRFEDCAKAKVYLGPDQDGDITLTREDLLARAKAGLVYRSTMSGMPPALIVDSSQDEWADPRATAFQVVIPAGTDDQGNQYPLPASITLKLA